MDKVAIQKDILEKQLGEEELPEKERMGILQELKWINQRWGSERGQNVDREKKPLWTSAEWVAIQVDRQMEWNEWHDTERAHRWKRLEDIGLLILRRRPVRNNTEDLGDKKGKQDNPKPMEALPGCPDGEKESDNRKVNRDKGQN